MDIESIRLRFFFRGILKPAGGLPWVPNKHQRTYSPSLTPQRTYRYIHYTFTVHRVMMLYNYNYIEFACYKGLYGALKPCCKMRLDHNT